MPIKTYKRSELRDIMDKRDAHVSKIGQDAAKRYLRSKEGAPTRGNIRAAVIFSLTMIMVILLLLVL